MGRELSLCAEIDRDLLVAAGEQEDFRLKFADEREAAVTKGRRSRDHS
jgi:hypothetical protein